MHRAWSLFALALAVALPAGCSSVNTHLMDATPDQGRAVLVPVPGEAAFQRVVEACADRGFRIEAVDEKALTLRASGRTGHWWDEEHVAIFVERVAPASCRLTVVSIDDDGEPTERDWAAKFVDHVLEGGRDGDLKHDGTTVTTQEGE